MDNYQVFFGFNNLFLNWLEGFKYFLHVNLPCDDEAQVLGPVHGLVVVYHLFVRSTVPQVGHDTASLRLVAALAGVEAPEHLEEGPGLAAVLPALHLAVNDAGVLALPVHVVDLSVIPVLYINMNKGVIKPFNTSLQGIISQLPVKVGQRMCST